MATGIAVQGVVNANVCCAGKSGVPAYTPRTMFIEPDVSCRRWTTLAEGQQ